MLTSPGGQLHIPARSPLLEQCSLSVTQTQQAWNVTRLWDRTTTHCAALKLAQTYPQQQACYCYYNRPAVISPSKTTSQAQNNIVLHIDCYFTKQNAKPSPQQQRTYITEKLSGREQNTGLPAWDIGKRSLMLLVNISADTSLCSAKPQVHSSKSNQSVWLYVLVFLGMTQQVLHTWIWGFSDILLCRSSQVLSGWMGSVGGQPFLGLSRDVRWVQVRDLAGPLKDIHRVVPKPLLCSVQLSLNLEQSPSPCR